MSWNDAKNVLLMIHDANSHYFLKILVWGSPNLDYQPKTLLLELTNRSFQVSKGQPSGSNRLKHRSRRFHRNNLDDLWYQQAILFQNFSIGVPKFGLSTQKATLKSGRPKFGDPITNFWENSYCWYHGSSRGLPWDPLKPYSSRFEPVVWILETWKDPLVTFRSNIFGR